MLPQTCSLKWLQQLHYVTSTINHTFLNLINLKMILRLYDLN